MTSRSGWAVNNSLTFLIDIYSSNVNGCVQQSTGANPPTMSGTFTNFYQRVKFPTVDRANFYGTTEWDKLYVNYSTASCGSCYVKFYVYNSSDALKLTSSSNPSSPIDISGVTEANIYVVAEIYRNSSPELYDITISAKNQVLPVELVSFKAKCEDEKETIQWKTASETNNQYFIIEGSNDEDLWEKILQVDGAGNSNNVITYEYEIDTSFDYYRIKQHDFDGHETYYYNIIDGIRCKKDYIISVYPNPCGTELNILTNKAGKYIIHNVLGIPIQSGKVYLYNTLLDMNNIKPGNYTITIYTDSDIYTFRFTRGN